MGLGDMREYMISIADAVEVSNIKFEIPGTDYRIAVASFFAEEKISMCFEADISLVSTDILDPERVMERTGVLSVKGSKATRYFHGVIREFRLRGRNGRFYEYECRLVPSLWFAGISQDCRIFQNMPVTDIVREVLREHCIYTNEYEFRFNEGKYKEKTAVRRQCVQYRETGLNFITRILEEEGIFFFFEHSRDRHLLVFADDNINCKSLRQLYEKENPLIVDSILECRDYSGQEEEGEAVREFLYSRSIRPGKVTQGAFNFKMPATPLTVTTHPGTGAAHEIYDYPCNYGHRDYGTRLAQIRLEEQKVFEKAVQVRSDCPLLMPGMVFDLSGHQIQSLDDGYLVMSIRHDGRQSHVFGEQSGIGGDSAYSNEFLAIQKRIPYRPGRITPKPYMRGMQTAKVVGPENQEIYMDEYGRVKVQFHWDRNADKMRFKSECSCWIRPAQAWAGAGHGTLFIPRVGDEVLVDFLEGDPDWPVIVGSVYGEMNRPLYRLPEKQMCSTIRTRSIPDSGGFNELRFADQAGEEEIYLHAAKDCNVVVLNDNRISIGNDRIEKVGSSLEITCGQSRFAMSKDGKVTITGTQLDLEASGPVRINGKTVNIN